MTEFEKVVYIVFAIATPLFIAFEIWFFAQRRRERDARGR